MDVTRPHVNSFALIFKEILNIFNGTFGPSGNPLVLIHNAWRTWESIVYLFDKTEEKPEYRGEAAALILDKRGMILECNHEAEKLFGYSASELIRRHVSLLLPQLAEGMLVRDDKINPKLKFMCHCGQLFLALDRHCRAFLSELHLVELAHPGRFAVRAILCPSRQ